MSDLNELKPCPFCGKPPVRFNISTASCDGLVDGKDVHNAIGMRPECWNARASGLAGVFGERDALKAEVLRLVDALTYAHSEGFQWPSDPLPFGSIAHDLFIYRGNDPERIAALSEGERKQEGSDNG